MHRASSHLPTALVMSRRVGTEIAAEVGDDRGHSQPTVLRGDEKICCGGIGISLCFVYMYFLFCLKDSWQWDIEAKEMVMMRRSG